jgi:predicted XRE-type DNA-binding protein
MSSFQITITPKERAAGRFVSRVRRALQKALAEEANERGINQSDIARMIGVNRSVISREIRGHKDLTLSRVGELVWAMGGVPLFEIQWPHSRQGSNLAQFGVQPQTVTSAQADLGPPVAPNVPPIRFSSLGS